MQPRCRLSRVIIQHFSGDGSFIRGVPILLISVYLENHGTWAYLSALKHSSVLAEGSSSSSIRRRDAVKQIKDTTDWIGPMRTFDLSKVCSSRELIGLRCCAGATWRTNQQYDMSALDLVVNTIIKFRTTLTSKCGTARFFNFVNEVLQRGI